MFKYNPELYLKCKKSKDIKNINNNSSRQKIILQFTLDNQFIRKYTRQELIDDGFKLKTIQACCRKETQTSCGYKWKYYDEYLKELESTTSPEVGAFSIVKE